MVAAIAETTWLTGEAVSPEGPLGTEALGLGKQLCEWVSSSLLVNVRVPVLLLGLSLPAPLVSVLGSQFVFLRVQPFSPLLLMLPDSASIAMRARASKGTNSRKCHDEGFLRSSKSGAT